MRASTFILLLAALAAVVGAGLPPKPPVAGGDVGTYIATHGKSLVREYVRAKLADVHPAGPSANGKLIDELVRQTHESLLDADAHEQHKRAVHMHRVARVGQ